MENETLYKQIRDALNGQDDPSQHAYNEFKRKNLSKLQELATELMMETFPERCTELMMDNSYNNQLEKNPLNIIIYCKAVQAYKNQENNTLLEEPKTFPDLSLLEQAENDQGTAFYMRLKHAQGDLITPNGNQDPIKTLTSNLNAYNKNIDEIPLIAQYGLSWGKEEVKHEDPEKNKDKNINFNDQLTDLLQNKYSGFLINYSGQFNEHFVEFMENPALTIAMAVYAETFEKQLNKSPSLEDMQKEKDIIELSTKLKSPDEDAVAVLNKVKENPQDYFTHHGFVNENEYQKRFKQTQAEAHALYGSLLDNYFEKRPCENKQEISDIINSRPLDVIALSIIAEKNQEIGLTTRIYDTKDLTTKLDLPEVKELSSQLNTILLQDTVEQAKDKAKPVPELTENKSKNNQQLKTTHYNIEYA